MPKSALGFCAALLIGVPMVGTAVAVAARPDSGVRGVVLYGPTCPVQRPGQICERPYQAAIVFRRAASRMVAATVSTGANGRFSVRLRPGRYLVKASGRTGHARTRSLVVSVTAHHFTDLSIHFDSGIR